MSNTIKVGALFTATPTDATGFNSLRDTTEGKQYEVIESKVYEGNGYHEIGVKFVDDVGDEVRVRATQITLVS